MIAHSLQAWATALGMERRTLETRIVKSGLKIPKKKGAKISARDISIAILGDKEAEQVRALKLDNEERERKARERDGILVEWEWVEAEQGRISAMLLAAFDAAPDAVSREWIEKVLKPSVREKLNKPNTKNQ